MNSLETLIIFVGTLNIVFLINLALLAAIFFLFQRKIWHLQRQIYEMIYGKPQNEIKDKEFWDKIHREAKEYRDKADTK